MNDAKRPIVSCIMPTYNRRAFVPHAIRYFLRQDYEPKELIIIDDGTDVIADLVPEAGNIHYYRLNNKITLGAKLNIGCGYAKGNIIAHWDDDDWYAPGRLAYQVETLQKEGTDICGINNLLYYDLRTGISYNYIYPSDQRVWIIGSSLCYSRECWTQHQFADINIGMDGLFVWQLKPDRISVHPDNTISVHMIHGSNVSPKKTEGVWWHAYPVEKIQKVMGADWLLYKHNGSVAPHSKINGTSLAKIKEAGLPTGIGNTAPKPVKNVYACLVHEKTNCIIDLVHNLHHNDPASIILLYNGGEDVNLIPKDFPFEQYGAVIHPKPAPVLYGYLHNFALDCMKFSLDNFSFETLTIVDSDQLTVRPGYSDYMGRFFFSQSNIGMLSSNNTRVTQDDNSNRIAAQAYKEYHLWEPLLNTFPEGKSKFVHWTYWPSTVFTRDAIRDLVKLFNDSRLLQHIMERTKIWASEEVILPTLVRLLGYDIAANPCSYEFMKYRKPTSFKDINQALGEKNVYWVHPIIRNYDDPVRTYIRGQFYQYNVQNKEIFDKNRSAPDSFRVLPLINRINRIEGWLSYREAELLISSAIKTLKTLPYVQTIVEIGSYHGKSTVLFGSVVKALFPGAKVYSIDPHDGKLGSEDEGLEIYPPSLEMFKTNIESAGIADVVEIIKNNSFNVTWDLPISLLFIDGLHDYNNVSRDFLHFSDWIMPAAFVAFHDYADYYPGVKKFVQELLATGKYRQIDKADSLMVLEKL